MASLGFVFDATTVEPIGPVPEGKYVVAIVNSAIVENRNGNGRHLLIEYAIQLPGEYMGRSLYSRLNLYHDNPTVVEMARAELSAICRAVGKTRISDSNELHGLYLTVDVRQDKTNEGKTYNRIVGYHTYVPNATNTVSPNTTRQPSKSTWKSSSSNESSSLY